MEISKKSSDFTKKELEKFIEDHNKLMEKATALDEIQSFLNDEMTYEAKHLKFDVAKLGTKIKLETFNLKAQIQKLSRKFDLMKRERAKNSIVEPVEEDLVAERHLKKAKENFEIFKQILELHEKFVDEINKKLKILYWDENVVLIDKF